MQCCRFVSKLSAFADRFKRAQANESRRATRGKTSQTSSRPTTQNGRNPLASNPPINNLANSNSNNHDLTVRRNRNDGQVVNMSVLFDTMQTMLKGVQIFDLLCPTSETMSQFSSLARHPYTHNLFNSSVPINTNIKQRINQPLDLPERKQSAQLLVIDVHVNIPGPKLPASVPVAGRKLNRQGSEDSGVDSPRNRASQISPSSSSASVSAYSVDIHQVVGIFNCSSERAPPNLDTGLFSYEHFHHIFQERVSTASGPQAKNLYKANNSSTVESDRMSATSGTSSSTNPVNAKDRGWSTTNAASGKFIWLLLFCFFQFLMLVL